jgi:hypothetical protein
VKKLLRFWTCLFFVLWSFHGFADNKEQGVEQFRIGVKLYRAGNFVGSLAAFQEAYRLNPTASALQNIALCQKDLFRYSDAIHSLETMLKEYDTILPQADKDAAQQTIKQLQPLVAHVRLVIKPAHAVVTIHNRNVEGGEQRQINLDVGEHQISAKAKGYKDFERTYTIAGGTKTIEIELEAQLGIFIVRTEDPEAAIAIDGVPMGHGVWQGEVTADVEHTIHIYKPGFAPTILKARVSKGKTEEVKGELGKAYNKDDGVTATPFPYTPPQIYGNGVGPYAFLTASYYLIISDPDNFKTPEKTDQTDRGGAYGGLRIGYRLIPRFGLELMGEIGSHSVGKGCYPNTSTCLEEQASVNYSLVSWRVGMLARYFSPGENVRFMASGGLGLAHHSLSLPGATPPGSAPEGKADAFNAFFFSEIGVQFNIRRLLMDFVLALAVDGVSNLEVESRRVYTEAKNVSMLGLGVRVGYSIWLLAAVRTPGPRFSHLESLEPL